MGIVIIALIVGSVYIAQQMIKGAVVSSLISEANAMKSAINAYKLEYGQLPGDHDEATDYFGSTDSHGKTVLNGNGNKKICCAGVWSGDGSIEILPAFQHMSLAGILPGYYFYHNTGNIQVTTHVPKAATGADDGWWLFYAGMNAQGWGLADIPIYGRSGNVLSVGDAAHDYLDGGVLTSQDTMAIDNKIDDGIPHKGEFFAIKGENVSGVGQASGCVDDWVNASSTSYKDVGTSDDEDCHPIWWLE